MPADPADGVKERLKSEWETNVPGRSTPVPDVVDAPEDGTGVLVMTNDENVRERTSTHDIIQCINLPSGGITTRGKDSEEVVDAVQIDIRISARDIDADALREGVRPRMLGERDAANDGDTLGGLAGEVWRILNGMADGWAEYDEAPFDRTIQYIRNSDARVTFTVENRIIERDRKRPLS